MQAIIDLVSEITKRIEGIENRKRSRDPTAQLSFEHAVRTIIIDLWKAAHSIPIRECLINKRSGYYSETRKYRDPLLTYKQTIAAFDGLLLLGQIEVTKEGYFDRSSLQGALTKFVAKDELLERLGEIDEYPAISIKPSPNDETIILRNVIDGQRKQVEYEDTPKTKQYRNNLKIVIQCFMRHWADLEIKDDDVAKPASAVAKDDEKQPIDLSARTLVRIFSNDSFKEGGRFYRGWWQSGTSVHVEVNTSL